MAVVTISRRIGSGGMELARRLSEILGYAVFDKELMAQVAADVGLAAAEVVDLSEESYKVKSFLTRLFGRGARIASEPESHLPGGIPVATGTLSLEQLEEARCVAFIRRTVLAAYERGNVVIVGRGGQAILRDRPGVLHVRLDAPEGARIRRIMERERCSFAQAYQKMVDRDRATAQYLYDFFGIRWDDPLLYHLVINTGKVEIEMAAQIVAAAVRYMDMAPAA